MVAWSFSADGSRILDQVVVDRAADTGIELLDVASGHTILLGKSGCTYSLTDAISDNGKAVAAVDGCGHMTIWRITASGPVSDRLPGSFAQTVGPIRFSPDGKYVAIANPIGNGDVRIINSTTGRATTTLAGHTTRSSVSRTAPTASCSQRQASTKSAKVWSPQSGQLLRTLDHPDPVYRVTFSPDSRTLATMDSAGIIRLWDACTDCQDSTALIALANKRVTRHLTPAEQQTYLH